MLPSFLVEETIVRESGESDVFNASEHDKVLLTLGITHAVEQESIGVDILGSPDGLSWSSDAVFSFTPKSYCGTYQMVVPTSSHRYLKAVWKPHRWSRADNRPFFRMYLHAEPQQEKILAASA
jgi:hypothetical protein